MRLRPRRQARRANRRRRAANFNVTGNNSQRRRNRRRGAPIDRAIARIADRQEGLITTPELRELGLENTDISYRVRIGRLFRVHLEVYAVGRPGLTQTGRFLAAILAVPGSALSHLSAVLHYGFLRPQAGDVHLTTQTPVRTRNGIRPHTCRDLVISKFRGIPIVPPARALLGLCSMPEIPDRWCRRAINQALVDERVRLDELFAECERPRPGVGRLRRLLVEAAPARSGLEDARIAELKRAGVPNFRSNAKRHGFEVDLCFPHLNLVFEIDSRRYHANPFARAYDAWKQAELERLGDRVIRVNETEDIVAIVVGTLARIST